MKLCGKDYIVPELTFTEVERMEVYSGVRMYDFVDDKYTMPVVRAFVQVVLGCDAATVANLLTEHIKQGGSEAYIALVNEVVEALLNSDFFCRALDLPTKAEREKENQEQSESPAET